MKVIIYIQEIARDMTALNPINDLELLNLCGIIVSYKLKNYQVDIRNSDGVLVNGNSIKHNYNFIKFAYEKWIKPLENIKKKKYLMNDRINSLGLLVELDKRILINYFTTI